jgi:hypothetical protein
VCGVLSFYFLNFDFKYNNSLFKNQNNANLDYLPAMNASHNASAVS